MLLASLQPLPGRYRLHPGSPRDARSSFTGLLGVTCAPASQTQALEIEILRSLANRFRLLPLKT
jgi:hypothetical protein